LITHYFTLFHLAKEWNERFYSWRIEEIFTQEKDELILALGKEEQHCFVLVSCTAQHNIASLREQYFRAKKNSLTIFPSLAGKKIERIYLHPADRIIFFELASHEKIALALTGTHANVFVLDGNAIVSDTFIKSEEATGKHLVALARSLCDEEKKDDEFLSRVALFPDESIYNALKKSAPHLGTLLAKEICSRANVGEKDLVGSLSVEKSNEIFFAFQQLHRESNAPAPRIYFENNTVKEFALFPLKYFSGLEEKIFSTVNDAVQSFIVLQRRNDGFQRMHRSLLASFQNKQKRILRSLAEIQKQRTATARVEEYELKAQLLLANLQHIHKGMKEITLPFFDDASQLLPIALDEKLNPVQNAERYFQKMKHAQRAYEALATRQENFENILQKIELLLIELSAITNGEVLNVFMKEKEKELTALGVSLNKEKEEEERIPFRVFTVAGGYEVWAGKSSANNDELTVHYSKPNDLWFHARGAGGSHVVLRCHGKNPPSKQAINETASIAAYYSKMRKAKNVPVAYCERKYVRKPKGVKEGTVYIEREEVIFVQPQLPHNMKGE
jgi:predicted ribosome quality control (RQC) complex YloA/Tae2 family protein